MPDETIQLVETPYHHIYHKAMQDVILTCKIFDDSNDHVYQKDYKNHQENCIHFIILASPIQSFGNSFGRSCSGFSLSSIHLTPNHFPLLTRHSSKLCNQFLHWGSNTFIHLWRSHFLHLWRWHDQDEIKYKCEFATDL